MAVATPPLPVTGKRKRQDIPESNVKSQKSAFAQLPAKPNGAGEQVHDCKAHTLQSTAPSLRDGNQQNRTLAPYTKSARSGSDVCLQIVAGSYERILHGVVARIPTPMLQDLSSDKGATAPEETQITFLDTFLFSAHTSAIRCLALSPPTDASKRLLATGSSDERVNVYSISTVPPPLLPTSNTAKGPSLGLASIAENPRNRSLGSLTHHDRAITCLQFPTKSKLFSAAEDNTIAISRTRDWTMLSSVKAPLPKPQGRPSGDTAGPGELPAGINDFAIHPSQKLMLSVGRREKCLRLWNLMTGKKAGVLNFSRDILERVGEGKYGSGEGRHVLWNNAGDAYIVGFERGAAVFGVDSKPRAIIKPSPPTKTHQMQFVQMGDDGLVAIATEDGRLLLFDTRIETAADGVEELPLCSCVAQLGGREKGITSRIKDFKVVRLPGAGAQQFLVVTASSDGAIRIWAVASSLFNTSEGAIITTGGMPQQVGQLLGTLETGNRITCVDAFVMDGKESVGDGAEDDEIADAGIEEDENSEGKIEE